MLGGDGSVGELPDVRVSLAHHLLDTPEEVPEVWMHAKIVVESSVGALVAIVGGRHHQHVDVEEVPVLDREGPLTPLLLDVVDQGDGEVPQLHVLDPLSLLVEEQEDLVQLLWGGEGKARHHPDKMAKFLVFLVFPSKLGT